MNKTPDIIKQLRIKNGFSQEELAKKVGYKDRTSIAKIEAGLVDLSMSKVQIFADIFNVSPVYIMALTDNPNPNLATSSPADFNATVIELPESTMIPVYGSIAAGVALEAIQDISGYIDIPSEWIIQGKTVIGLKIKGDSMYPSYFEGDIVIIQCDTEYSSGDDCAVYINGYDATIKRIKLLEDGIELIPLNTSYPPKRYRPEEFSILGKVIELRRQI